jgi:hypothetical protein
MARDASRHERPYSSTWDPSAFDTRT